MSYIKKDESIMSTPRSYHQAKAQDYVFILWGDQFEEKAVATFVAELRNASLCVKVVGLSGPRTAGKHGLVLGADITLSEALALAHKAICVIVPCSAPSIKRLDNDPRVLDFFRQAHTHRSQFVVSENNALEKSSMSKLTIAPEDVFFYADYPDLTQFAREMANELLNHTVKL